MPVTIGNRVTEKDVRDWLDVHGHDGRSAKITGLDLYAIKRPGWVQVFGFSLRVKSNPQQDSKHSIEFDEVEWLERFGVVLDDERKLSQESRTQVWIFENEEDQKQKLSSLSDGLITCQRKQNGQLIWFVGILLCLLLVAGIVSSFFQ